MMTETLPENTPENTPNTAPDTNNTDTNNTGYRVLARKYRPTTFDDMIGQETLVRTLSNAIQSGRIAQAYVLTGVRGIGKTTTARIIAKALNHTNGPTVDLSQPCDHCDAITSDSHVDVVEMDAASHTGIEDIREIIESVKYRPVHARYKIFILDEVHMLSKNAFNALLKTLEEPPAHVKFIFATTEIRKVPITILSRCQRFDLRRISTAELADHYTKICGLENITADPESITMIAHSADGSVRDGLSLLDQAIALQTNGITAELVRDMLGLTNRGQVYELVQHLMAGDGNRALDMVGSMHAMGADPLTICNDVLDCVWFMTRCRVNPALKDDPNTPEAERTKGAEMAEKLDVATLSRAWQILMAGIPEIKSAPNDLQALEMVFIRLIHAGSLPTPDKIIKQLETAPQHPTTGAENGANTGETPPNAPTANFNQGATPAPQTPIQNNTPTTGKLLPTFRDMVDHLKDTKQAMLALTLANDVTHTQYTMTDNNGFMELNATPVVSNDFSTKLKRVLESQTGVPWTITINRTQTPNTPQNTLAQTVQAETKASVDRAESDPLVVALRQHFPTVKIERVTPTPGGKLDMTNADMANESTEPQTATNQ